MRIIDANTGTEVHLGTTFENIDGIHTLMQVKEGLFSARALFRSSVQGARRDHWVPLVVRYMHPGFMFQKVGFIPS